MTDHLADYNRKDAKERFVFLRNSLLNADFNFQPSGWRYAGDVQDLKRGPVRTQICNEEIVLFKTATGDIVATQGRCPHMNAPLWQGKVVENSIQCPMHGRRFNGRNGACQSHGSDNVRCFPTRVLGTHIFIAADANSAPVFPYFDEAPHTAFAYGRAIYDVVNVPWYLVLANGFDVSHFPYIHGREVLGDSGPLFKGHNRIDIQYALRNTSQLVTDRLLRRLAGDKVQLNYRVFNGNTVLPMTIVKDKASYIWIDVQPVDQRRTRVTMIPVMRVDRQPMWHRYLNGVSLALRSVFIKHFFTAELPYIENIELRPTMLSHNDLPMMEFLHWLKQQNPAVVEAKGNTKLIPLQAEMAQ